MNFLVCPLTGKQFEKPVVAADGFTYEKDAIEEWFKNGHTNSPLTGEPLSTTDLIPNNAIKSIIKNNEQFIKINNDYNDALAELIFKKQNGKQTLDTVKKNLKDSKQIFNNYRIGKITAEKCSNEFEISKNNEILIDAETLLEQSIICLWAKNYPKAQKLLESPLLIEEATSVAFLNVYIKSQKNLKEANDDFDKIMNSRELNLFKVKELKYKGIALIGLQKPSIAKDTFDSYEQLITYDPSFYVLFKTRALTMCNLASEVQKFVAEWIIKYGEFAELRMIGNTATHNTEKLSNVKGNKKSGNK